MLVAAVILLVFAVLLNIYVSVDLRYTGGDFYWGVKYTFIKIISSDTLKKEKKPKKEKRKKQKKERNGVAAEENPDSEKKTGTDGRKNKKGRRKKSAVKEYLENISAVIDFVRSSANSVLGLTRKIRISDICADCLVADADAYSCALNYGMLSAGIYNILAFVSAYFKTDIDHVNIGQKYNGNDSESRYDFSAKVKLKPGSALIAAIGILISFIKLQIVKEKEKDVSNKKVKTKEYNDMEKHPVNNLMGTAIEKIRDMIDVNTIIGNPISTADGSTIIPVSKVSFGFASGGSDLPSKSPKDLFGGAAGAGVSVQPLAFICVSPSGDVKLLQMSVNVSKENAIISTLPDLIDKISGLVNGGEKKEKAEKHAVSKKSGKKSAPAAAETAAAKADADADVISEEE